MNSHYVPQTVLRKFSINEKVSLFNVKTQEYKENVKTKYAFSKNDFYDDETERNLNVKVESQFGDLFANKLLKCKDSVELSREELYKIKKFLLVSVLRGVRSSELMQFEKKFYEYLGTPPPFQEKTISGETEKEYWLRTLNVVLDTDGTARQVLQQENKTYPAYRWATVIEAGYVAFWDSDSSTDEFLITDVGMTSENEKGWNGYDVHNRKKTECLLKILEEVAHKGKEYVDIGKEVLRVLKMCVDFHENFMMFPISAKRMIVLICPFYKFRKYYEQRFTMPKLSDLTLLCNEELYSPNEANYVYPQNGMWNMKYHKDDRYLYQIKKLTKKEVRYCNALFLDRVDTWVGFSSFEKIVGSLKTYQKFAQIKNYDKLYQKIKNGIWEI